MVDGDPRRRLREALLLAHGAVPVEQLLGVRPEALDELHDRGVPTRVYVPYGADWFRYWMRRARRVPRRLRMRRRPSPTVTTIDRVPMVEPTTAVAVFPIGSPSSYDAGDDKSPRKPALVLDIDETSLSNYSAISADNFTYGTNLQAEARPHARTRSTTCERRGSTAGTPSS